MEHLYDLLFEVSNEARHQILVLLKEEPLNLSQLSRRLDLRLPEVSRHVSRLLEVEVIRKNLDGTYSLSSYGELVLGQVDELSFISRHRSYFISHTLSIPGEYVSRLGELSGSVLADNMMNFLRFIEETVSESDEYVWMQVDEIPYTLRNSFEDAVGRGTSFKIIRKGGEVSEEFRGLANHPQVEVSSSSYIGLLLFLSKMKAAVAFPTHGGRFDYTGFMASAPEAVGWCHDLFQRLLGEAEKEGEIIGGPSGEAVSRVTVLGRDDPKYDRITVQQAVDSYDEVTLQGVFNFGDSGITISRSCVLRGEGRENDVPLTKMYKKGWQMPFTSNEWLVRAKGEDTHVTIENIHFTDFNDICIYGDGGASIIIRKNRVTLETGFNRGRRHPYGDMVTGIVVGHFGAPENVKYYPDGVYIEDNFLDFALSPPRRRYASPYDKRDDPSYRPNLLEEYYCGVGIFVLHVEGRVSIRKNIVRNMNSAGINVSDCQPTAKAEIIGNEIVSDVLGAYVHNWVESGFGITVHSATAFFHEPGLSVTVARNIIQCSKRHYGGVMIMGPFNLPEWAGKMGAGTVTENMIHLDDGFVGIKVGRNDSIQVLDNTLSGRAYYGVRVHGRDRVPGADIYAEGNTITGNDMTRLEIKEHDDYSDGYADGFMFAGARGESETAHVWLDSLTRGNVVEVGVGEKVLDEGQDNKTSYREA